jgi:hypothetical protein
MGVLRQISVVGSILLHDDARGELAAYGGIDRSAVELPGECHQLIWIDDHLLKDDARRLAVREEGRKPSDEISGAPITRWRKS